MNFDLNTWTAVGEALTGTWHVGHPAGRENAAVLLLREDGFQILVQESWDTPSGKVEIRLSMNGGEWDYKRYSEKIPAINVTPTRKPEALARDIERRLIPAAEEFRQVILERAAQRDEYQRKVDALREELIATGAVDRPQHLGDPLRLKRGVGLYGDVTHGDDYVKFDFTLPAKDALEVLALLAERRAK